MRSDFWDAVIVVAIVILIVAVIELWERFRRPPSADNPHEQARQDRIDAANLAAFYAPPKHGPKGFHAQVDRRAHVQQIRSRKVN